MRTQSAEDLCDRVLPQRVGRVHEHEVEDPRLRVILSGQPGEVVEHISGVDFGRMIEAELVSVGFQGAGCGQGGIDEVDLCGSPGHSFEAETAGTCEEVEDVRGLQHSVAVEHGEQRLFHPVRRRTGVRPRRGGQFGPFVCSGDDPHVCLLSLPR